MNISRKFLQAVLVSGVLVSISACDNKAPEPQKETAAPQAQISTPLAAGEWGPSETAAGTPFNLQPNGKSAMWVNVSGLDVSKSVEVTIGQTKGEDVNATEKLVTFTVDAAAYEKPGDYPVVIKELSSGRVLNVGVFKVK